MAPKTTQIKLSQLDMNIWQPKIIARLFKIWQAENPSTCQIYSVDCILIDEEGTAIEGVIEVTDLKKIRPQLIEGKIFEIMNFQIMDARFNYRTVDHKYHLKFGQTTKIIMKDEVPGFPKLYFNFQELENIGKTIVETNSVVDIIGKVTSFKSACNMPRGSVLIWDLEISNEKGHTVRVTVWAEFNSLLNEEEIFEKSKTKPVVIAFSTLQLVIDFNGFKLKTYSGTRIFMDEAIPEIGEAKKKVQCNTINCVAIERN